MMQDGEIRKSHNSAAQHGHDAARRARLFEMLRQRELAAKALERLDLRRQADAPVPLPSPAALAASLADQSSIRPS
ncbi:MAG: hypothetical protein ACNA7O_14275 [Rhodobacterales bacterium]